MNLLNYFNTFADGNSGTPGCFPGGGDSDCRGANNEAEFTRQSTKIVNAIIAMDPDVIGIAEMENDGYGSTSAIKDLVDKLNAVSGAGPYAFINPDTANGLNSMGTDAIKVGILYQPANVTPVGTTAVLNSIAFVNGGDGAARNRVSLLQAFQTTAGGTFLININHLKSKGSACDVADAGDGQGNCNIVRTNAVNALLDWFGTDPTGTGDPDILVMGDLNSYAREDPIRALETGGYTDMVNHFGGASTYSYVFDGQWGYLDYAMGSPSMLAQTSSAAEWHINSDEPSVLDYNTEYKTAGQITSLYNTDPYRTGDHDPIIVSFNLQASTVWVCESGDCGHPGLSYHTIQEAIAAVAANGTINVAAGTYVETGQIVINKNLSIVGADKATTMIKPSADTGSSGDARGWFLVQAGVTFNMSNVTLDGTGYKLFQGIRDLGSGTFDNIAFKQIQYEPSGGAYAGTAIAAFGGSGANVNVTNSTFANIGRVGVLFFGAGSTGTFDNNVYTGKGPGNWLDYGVEVGGGAQATISNSTFTACQGVATVDGSTSAGIIVSTYYGAGTQATITGNTINNNTDGIAIGYDASDTSVVTIHTNSLHDNSGYGIVSTDPTVDAVNNWWGAASGPGPVGPGTGDKVSNNVSFTPWCVNEACSSAQPPLPSSFWGYFKFYDGAPTSSSVLTANIDGMTGPAASVSVIEGSPWPHYAFNVPGDLEGTTVKEGGVEGNIITFKIGTRIIGTAVWHGGTNYELDFHPPQALPGVYNGLVNTTITLTGHANDWGLDAATYAWDLAGGTTYGTPDPASFSKTAVGSYTVGLKVTDAQHGEGTATTSVIVIDVAGLTGQVYDGTPKVVTVTGDPGTPVIAYTGADSTHTNAGSYAVTVTTSNGAVLTGLTMVIDPKPVTVTPNSGQNKLEGAPDPVFTYTSSDPAATFSGVLSRDPGSTPGAYPIRQGTLLGTGNYTIGSFVSVDFYIQGTCTVNNLVAGWNLVSLCLAPVNTEPGTVLNSLVGKYDLVYGWDGSVATNNWLKFAPGGPSYANDMTSLDEKMGFWVHMTAPGALTVTGYPPVTTSIPLSTAGGGWNLIGYPSLTAMTLPGTLHDFSLIYAYKISEDLVDPWKLYDSAAPTFVNDLTSLTAAWGYWIKVGASYPWNVGY